MVNSDAIKKLLEYTDDEETKRLAGSISESIDTVNRASHNQKRAADKVENFAKCLNVSPEMAKHMAFTKDDWGLILGGGGGKGAYQIGAMRAMRECLPFEFKAVGGTSVGGLNAVLFSSVTQAEAEEIWHDIDPVDVLTPHDVDETDLDELGMIIKYEGDMLKKDLVTAFVKRREAFSRKGLKRIIEKYSIGKKLSSTNIPCEVTCFNIDTAKPENYLVNELSDDDVTSVMLATSAMPIVYKPEEFMGKRFYDGGFPILGNNVPLSGLYELGLRKFIVLHLSPAEKTSDDLGYARLNRKFLNETFYSGAVYIHIYPSKDLGDLFDGTLNYNEEYINKTIEFGYNDMKEKLYNIYVAEDLNPDEYGEAHILEGKVFRNYDALLASQVKG